MKKMLSFIAVMIVCVSMVGCGKVEVYKTEHKSGKKTINKLEEITFEKRITPEEVAKTFDDFCIYEDGDDYKALVPIKWGVVSGEFEIEFNADKEFEGWSYTKYYGKEYYKTNYTDIYNDFTAIHNQITDEYGEPSYHETNETYAKGYILDYWSAGNDGRIGLCLNDGGYISFSYKTID